jgi:hypothetical protein
MDQQLIITHPGSAHFDDLTAVSLVLASCQLQRFRIERREPSSAELDDPGIWVIDTGGRHEPEKLNFDHHQSLECPSAYVLVADYLGLLDTLSIMPWWDFKDYVDRFGAARASEIFNAGDDLVNRNPVEDWLVSQFASEPQASLPLLKSYGTRLIKDARTLKRQIDFWKKSSRLMINGIPAMIGETRESAGLDEFRRRDKNPPDVVISLDRRGEGWRLFRYEGVPVDFSRIAGEPEVAFAHKSGFMATTRKRLTRDQLVTLVSKAVVEDVT